MATRRERVVLDLQDNFTAGMVKAAGATQLLDKALHGLDGSSTDVNRSLSSSAVETDRVSTSARKADASINQLTGRLRLMADVAAILGPSLVPIGAVAVPAVTGLASQLGFAAIGAGSLVTAFQGVGDALKAVNDAALDPTAANLEKAQAAMAQLGPDAQAFVTRFQELRPVLRDIRDASAAGWFPGLTESMDDFERIAPQVASLFESIGRVGGDLIAEGMANFAGPGWDSFREMVGTEAPRMLEDLGRTVGNLIAGMAHLWEAFTPLNSDFSDWLLDASRSFERWADGLSRTEGFNEFVDYIRTNGPRVADALKAVGDAVLEIIEAIAPLGGPSLKIIETFAKVIASIADSDLGTPIFGLVAAYAALNRVLRVTAALQTRITGSSSIAAGGGLAGMIGIGASARTGLKGTLADLRAMSTEYGNVGRAQSTMLSGLSRTTGAAQRTTARLSGLGKTAGVVGGLAVATSGLADGMGLSNTASLALMGTIAGPWGAAIGAGAGLAWDLGSAISGAANASGDLDAIMGQQATTIEQMIAKRDQLTEHYSNIGGLKGAALYIGDKLGLNDAVDDAKAAGREVAQLNADIAKSSDLAFLAQNNLSQGFANTAKAAGMTAQELYAMTSALDAQVDAALGAAEADLQWRNTLAAAREQAASNSAGIRGMSEDARNNKAALLSLARAWNTQRDAMVENGASAAAVKRRHEAARDEFVRVAVQMGVNAKEARDLAREYLKIPEKVKTSVVLDGAQAAKATIAEIRRQLAGIPKSVQTTYRVNRVGDIPKGSQGLTPSNPSLGDLLGGSADGGFVPKTGLPYADRHLYMLADGEGITTNRRGETDRFRDVISGINAGMTRAQVKGMLADGGFAGRPPVSQMRSLAPAWPSYSPSLSVDLSPLERRLAAVESAIHANTADRGAQTDRKIKSDRYGASAAARSWTRGVS